MSMANTNKTIESDDPARISSTGAGLGALAGLTAGLPLAALSQELRGLQTVAETGRPPRIPRDRYDGLVDKLHTFFTKRNEGVGRLSQVGNKTRQLLHRATLAGAPKSRAGLLAWLGGSTLLGSLAGSAAGHGLQGVLSKAKKEVPQVEKKAAGLRERTFENSNPNLTHTHTMTPFALLEKSAAVFNEATLQDHLARRKERDESALRNRHIALTLKRALLGAALGGGLGGLTGAGESGGDLAKTKSKALIGLLAGGALGAGVGAAEGGIRRSLGLDPLLETQLVAHRA